MVATDNRMTRGPALRWHALTGNGYQIDPVRTVTRGYLSADGPQMDPVRVSCWKPFPITRFDDRRLSRDATGSVRGSSPPLGTDDPKGRTRDEVARAVGLGSGRLFAKCRNCGTWLEVVRRRITRSPSP